MPSSILQTEPPLAPVKKNVDDQAKIASNTPAHHPLEFAGKVGSPTNPIAAETGDENDRCEIVVGDANSRPTTPEATGFRNATEDGNGSTWSSAQPELTGGSAATARRNGRTDMGRTDEGEIGAVGHKRWMADKDVVACMSCFDAFTIRKRKHHCRSCGRIFCADCTLAKVPLPELGHLQPVRVCESCRIKIDHGSSLSLVEDIDARDLMLESLKAALKQKVSLLNTVRSFFNEVADDIAPTITEFEQEGRREKWDADHESMDGAIEHTRQLLHGYGERLRGLAERLKSADRELDHRRDESLASRTEIETLTVQLRATERENDRQREMIRDLRSQLLSQDYQEGFSVLVASDRSIDSAAFGGRRYSKRLGSASLVTANPNPPASSCCSCLITSLSRLCGPRGGKARSHDRSRSLSRSQSRSSFRSGGGGDFGVSRFVDGYRALHDTAATSASRGATRIGIRNDGGRHDGVGSDSLRKGDVKNAGRASGGIQTSISSCATMVGASTTSLESMNRQRGRSTDQDDDCDDDDYDLDSTEQNGEPNRKTCRRNRDRANRSGETLKGRESRSSPDMNSRKPLAPHVLLHPQAPSLSSSERDSNGEEYAAHCGASPARTAPFWGPCSPSGPGSGRLARRSGAGSEPVGERANREKGRVRGGVGFEEGGDGTAVDGAAGDERGCRGRNEGAGRAGANGGSALCSPVTGEQRAQALAGGPRGREARTSETQQIFVNRHRNPLRIPRHPDSAPGTDVARFLDSGRRYSATDEMSTARIEAHPTIGAHLKIGAEPVGREPMLEGSMRGEERAERLRLSVTSSPAPPATLRSGAPWDSTATSRTRAETGIRWGFGKSSFPRRLGLPGQSDLDGFNELPRYSHKVPLRK